MTMNTLKAVLAFATIAPAAALASPSTLSTEGDKKGELKFSGENDHYCGLHIEKEEGTLGFNDEYVQGEHAEISVVNNAKQNGMSLRLSGIDYSNKLEGNVTKDDVFFKVGDKEFSATDWSNEKSISVGTYEVQSKLTLNEWEVPQADNHQVTATYTLNCS